MTSILEDAQTLDIQKWGTLNTVSSPQKLPEGHSPDNNNVWMDEKPGSVVTANGYQLLGTIPSGNPVTFLINFFKTSDGSQTLIVSDGSTVWKTTDFVTFTSIKTGLSSFYQLRGLVIRNKLWLTNGVDPVMTYDGTTLTLLDGTGGTPNVPSGKYIAYHDERVWIYGITGEPSSLRFSDLTDSSGTEITPDDASAWPVDNEIQISEGDADIGTGLFVYRGYLYASKAYSIWRVVGYDEYTYTKVKTRSSTGTRFAESIRELDNLVHFIGIDGLYTFNGEESQRISDLIDPANPDEGVFSFRNIQQPLLNNKFWNLSSTADFDAGTIPRNVSTENDKLTITADDTIAKFSLGGLTDIDSDFYLGRVILARESSGGSSDRVTKTGGYLDDSNNGAVIFGNESSLYDLLTTPMTGLGVRNSSNNRMVVTFDVPTWIGRITLRNVQADTNILASIQVNTGSVQTKYGTEGTWETVGTFQWAPGGAWTTQDVTVDFTQKLARQVSIFFSVASGSYQVGEIDAYRLAYKTSGRYVSYPVDYVSPPVSFGYFAAHVYPAGQTYRFFTQSSDDGVTWEPETLFLPNTDFGEIGSIVKRYLRWGVYLYSSDGLSSPSIASVYLAGSYISPIFNTGGNIFQWGSFQVAANKSGQTVKTYYRAASTSGLVVSSPWTEIVNGAIPATAITNVFIQLRVEMWTAIYSRIPYVTSTTFNWIVGNGEGVNTLQNVASFVWRNRYWLSAATVGASANDIVIVRGKLTYGNPWHKKDFELLSFERFLDYFIAGSSVDGSIYGLETGYSKNGSAMDSYYETADFDKSGFLLKLMEIIVNTDRTGPYDLNVGISIDGGITWTDKTIDLTRSSPTQNSSFTKKLITGNIMADKFRLRLRINAADQPFSVDGLTVYYRLSPIRGSLN